MPADPTKKTLGQKLRAGIMSATGAANVQQGFYAGIDADRIDAPSLKPQRRPENMTNGMADPAKIAKSRAKANQQRIQNPTKEQRERAYRG